MFAAIAAICAILAAHAAHAPVGPRPHPTRPAASQAQHTNSPSPGPSASAGITVTGTVQPGIEAGCLLLGRYLLLGGDPAVIYPGARVTVVGHLATGVVTYCMQGIPLRVDSARPA